MKDKGFTLIELLIVIIILGILAAITTFAIQAATTHDVNSDVVPNTDPRNGWVQVDEDLTKRCDGNNMLYYDEYHGTYNVASNSPECVG